MNITRSVKNALRPLRDIIFSIFGFLYDLGRFYRFGGWRASLNDSVQRNYKAVKAYHSLEKSLSFRDRKQGFGQLPVHHGQHHLYECLCYVCGFHFGT